MTYQVIGYIETCFPQKLGTPRQSGLVPLAQGRIKILKEYQPELSLIGLKGFSHIWVLFHFHKNNQSDFRAKVRPPRLQGESMGIFATRSPHRPNPIGLSLFKVLEIKQEEILVEGVDTIDQTPVLDIKPYIPEYDCLPEAQSGWAGLAEEKNIQVQFDLEFLKKFESLFGIEQKHRLDLLEQVLKKDFTAGLPRQEDYKIALDDGDYSVQVSGDRFTVTDVRLRR